MWGTFNTNKRCHIPVKDLLHNPFLFCFVFVFGAALCCKRPTLILYIFHKLFFPKWVLLLRQIYWFLFLLFFFKYIFDFIPTKSHKEPLLIIIRIMSASLKFFEAQEVVFGNPVLDGLRCLQLYSYHFNPWCWYLYFQWLLFSYLQIPEEAPPDEFIT